MRPMHWPVAAPLTGLRVPALAMFEAGKGGASEQQCTVALVKNIVGTGVLTLPAGIARLSDSGMASSDALAGAIAMCIVFCGMSAYGFALIGEACCATGEASYVGAWRSTLGTRAAFLPALASLVLCFTAGVSCATVITDTLTDLVSGLSAVDYDLLPRNSILATVASTVLLPLCLLPSLAPLGTASLVGVGGVFVTASVMISRLADQSYAATGAFADVAVWPPAFHGAAAAATDAAAANADSLVVGLSMLPDAGRVCFFASLLSNAFLAHYNAPAVYSELAAMPAPPVAGPPTAEEPLSRLRLAQRAEAVNQNFRAFIESTRLGVLRRSLNGGGVDGGGTEAEESVIVIADGSMRDGLIDAQLAAFRRVVVSAFGISCVLFVLIAGAGFGTFGDASQPLILSNYASSDPLAAVAVRGRSSPAHKSLGVRASQSQC